MIQVLNQLRMKYTGKTFSREEIRKILSVLDRGNDQTFFGLLIKHQCIIRIKHGVYTFTIQPVYKQQLEAAYNELRKTQRDYMRKNNTDAIQKAIDLLQSSGYLVYKKI